MFPEAGSLGKPVPGVRVEVQAPDGARCPTDDDRRDQGVAPRRLVPDEGSRSDRCGRVPFGTAGRADDVIISAGWTIGPTEVEDAILRHPGVAEAAVIGVPDMRPAATW